jgi:hypothetical protein
MTFATAQHGTPGLETEPPTDVKGAKATVAITRPRGANPALPGPARWPAAGSEMT